MLKSLILPESLAFVHSDKSEFTVLRFFEISKLFASALHRYCFYSLNLSRFLFTVQLSRFFVVRNNFCSLSYFQVVVNNFFILFFHIFRCGVVSLDSSFILSQAFSFVNNFFQLFLSCFSVAHDSIYTFRVTFSTCFSATSATACLYYHLNQQLSTTFFIFFKESFYDKNE